MKRDQRQTVRQYKNYRVASEIPRWEKPLVVDQDTLPDMEKRHETTSLCHF